MKSHIYLRNYCNCNSLCTDSALDDILPSQEREDKDEKNNEDIKLVKYFLSYLILICQSRMLLLVVVNGSYFWKCLRYLRRNTGDKNHGFLEVLNLGREKARGYFREASDK